MERSTLKTIAIVAGALIVLCFCAALTLAGAAYIFREDLLAFGLRTTTQTEITPYGELPPAPPTDEMPPNGDLESQFATIETIIIGVRGLDLGEPVPRSFLSRSVLAENVQNDLLSDYPPEDAADDAAMLSAFDVVEADFDLLGMYQALYTQGIAGYYDPEERAFYIVGEDEILDPEEEITYAHELVHVLQDQSFDLNSYMNYDDDEFFLANADEALARQAVVEGDATITERLYEQYFMLDDRVDAYYLAQLEYDFSFLSEVPEFIISSFIFPYTTGADFVQYVYDRGGFAAVDELYGNPPLSTEQILHPEKYYEGDDPVSVEVADALPVLGAGYRSIYVSQMGEYGIREYVRQRIPSDAADAAAGWGGDRYEAYINDETGSVVLNFRIDWDNAAEADEFVSLYGEYLTVWDTTEAGFSGDCGEQGTVVLCLFRLDEAATLIVRAPTQATAEQLRDLYER